MVPARREHHHTNAAINKKNGLQITDSDDRGDGKYGRFEGSDTDEDGGEIENQKNIPVSSSASTNHASITGLIYTSLLHFICILYFFK